MNNINIIDHTLYPYQERDMNELLKALEANRKVCFQAITSYGKTICFSTLSKWYKHLNKYKKILVIAHREELIEQSASSLIKMGMTVEKILPSTKRLHHMADVYIAMERTLTNRLNKNKKYLKDLGLVIIDECHIGNFFPHIERFTDPKIIGFTATPLLNDRITYWKCPRCKSISNEVDECCGHEMEEWGKPRTLSMYFDDIVIGASTTELIEFGSIVKDINYIEPIDNLESLKKDSSGEYTSESQNSVFGKKESVLSCIKNYELHCNNEKTMIFNPSAKVNKMVYDEFKKRGYNIRIYDSVNDKEGSRKELVKWFEENDDAIITNVAVFTTGFSSNNVKNIILNRSIGSLPLYMQICGRGARSSKTIYKDSFRVLDLGGNVSEHNKWSDNTRDWRKMFFEGNSKDKAKVETPLQVAECQECSYLFPRSQATCPNCGYTVPSKEKKEIQYIETILTPIDSVPLPDGKKIAKYAIGRGEDIHFCFKVMYEQILDLFRFNLVSKAQYLSNKNDGRLSKRLCEIIRPVYFTLISTPEFKSDTNRTLKYVTKKTIEKLDKYYDS